MESEEIEIFKIFKDTRIFSKDGNLWKGALWEVSNLGSVRKNGEEYIPCENGSGYLTFGHYFVHRAVAELFLETIDSKPTVDHKNRQKFDNRASNLRWATYQEQMANRDKDVVSKSISKSLIGNKNALGHRLSEETKAKISAANIGNKNALGHKDTEETKAKKRAASLGNKNLLGYRHSEEAKVKMSKYVSNTVWIIHPMKNDRKRIPKEQLPEFLDKGYIKGKKIKK